MISDEFRIIGNVTICNAETHEVLASSHNKVVNLGISRILELISGETASSGNIMSYIALGTGNTSVTENDTELDNERVRESCEASVSNNVLYLTSYISKNSSSFVIKEAGVFDKAASVSNALMFCRSILDTPYDNATDPKNLAVTWTLTLTNN